MDPAAQEAARLAPGASYFPVLAAFALVLITTWLLLKFVLGSGSGGRGKRAVIVGPCNAGKTALFHELTQGKQPPGGTVASMQENEGQAGVRDASGKPAGSCRVVDVPGHDRLRHKLDAQLSDARCIVFVLDAVDITPHKTEAAEELFEVRRGRGHGSLRHAAMRHASCIRGSWMSPKTRRDVLSPMRTCRCSPTQRSRAAACQCSSRATRWTRTWRCGLRAVGGHGRLSSHIDTHTQQTRTHAQAHSPEFIERTLQKQLDAMRKTRLVALSPEAAAKVTGVVGVTRRGACTIRMRHTRARMARPHSCPLLAPPLMPAPSHRALPCAHHPRRPCSARTPPSRSLCRACATR
jgi:hypothetical protein